MTKKVKPGSVTASVREATKQMRAADLIAAAQQRRGGVPAWQPPAAAIADLDEVIQHNASNPTMSVSAERVRVWLETDHGTSVSRECVRTYMIRRAKVLGV